MSMKKRVSKQKNIYKNDKKWYDEFMKINPNKKNINIISFFISLIIFIFIISILNKLSSKTCLSQNQIYNENIIQNELLLNEVKDFPIDDIYYWKIKIDKINLSANIAEGTLDEILESSIGHYPQTNTGYGIIALKAFNTGHENNYFSNLKELEIGEEINYYINDLHFKYKVIENTIIKSEEEENIINSYEGDKLILMTYVKDLPNTLRCVVSEKCNSKLT